MGTKACIARHEDSGWSGYYVHSDGGPEHTGRIVVEMFRDRGAEAVLQYAAQAPQGWTRFPDEPSIYHDEPFTITPEQDGGVEWVYLIDMDRISVYRGEAWGEPGCRRFERLTIIDPQDPDAVRAMTALSGPRLDPDELTPYAVDPFHRPPATRLSPPPGGLRMTPEGLVEMLLAMDTRDQTVDLTGAEADVAIIGSIVNKMTVDHLLAEAARTVETALRPDQMAEARYEALADLSQIIEALRWECSSGGAA